jgi:biotin synthase
MALFTDADALYGKALRNSIDKKDMLAIASWPEQEFSVLMAVADQVKRHFLGNTVRPCSILNIKSGNCPQDCAFCSQSAHNYAKIDIYDLVPTETITKKYALVKERNCDFGIVSSGRGLTDLEVEELAEAIRKCGGPVHASLGILTERQFSVLKDAGVTCYHHNLETSRNFFPRIVTTHSYDERVETVRLAKRMGFEVCSGGIFGLGETWEDRIELCLELKRLDVDRVPINFLVPIEGTRVAPPAETPFEFLKIVCLYRLALPDKSIRVCGGREYHLRSLQPLLFLAGADGYITGGYLTTTGAGVESDERMIEDLGLVKAGSI